MKNKPVGNTGFHTLEAFTMVDFPMPVGGEAWVTGGVKGKVRGSSMQRRARRSSHRRKPWESTNWIPYIGQFNNSAFIENIAVTTGQVLSTCAQVKRVFMFAPSLMNQETLLPDSTGRVATEETMKLLRMQGHIHFDGLSYISTSSADPTGENQVDATQAQNGDVERVWYSWQKERMTPQGYVENISDLGIGPNVLGGVKQMQNRHLLSWGILTWQKPPANPAGVFVGGARGDRDYKIPNPKLPPGGLKLGVGDALSCIVRVSMGLNFGRDLADDANQSMALPISLSFQPYMRLLVSA